MSIIGDFILRFFVYLMILSFTTFVVSIVYIWFKNNYRKFSKSSLIKSFKKILKIIFIPAFVTYRIVDTDINISAYCNEEILKLDETKEDCMRKIVLETLVKEDCRIIRYLTEKIIRVLYSIKL